MDANTTSRRWQYFVSRIEKELEQWDFNVAGIEDFGKVMDTFESFNPEIVILDVQLPKYDGFYWCRKMREVSNVPILFLSSRDNPMDQVMSMELGADDYMQKPFYTNVLIAKLQAIYRRVYEFTAEEKRTLTWQDAVVDLSKDSIQKRWRYDFSIQNRNDYIRNSYYQKNQIVSRDTIITALWDDEAFVSDNTLTVNVNRLRKKLSEISMDSAIETKIGKGYMAHE